MKPISELTYLVLARPALQDFDIDIAINWAAEMIALGHDTPNLLMLAATSKPCNYFETLAYLANALKELNWKELYGEEAFVAYGYYYVQKLARAADVKSNLRALTVHRSDAYQGLFINFFLLNWAWGNYPPGGIENEYWPGASDSNIERLIQNEAMRWLQEHSQLISRSA